MKERFLEDGLNLLTFLARRPTLLVELRGGVGNQLFIYAALKYFENRGNFKLIFDDAGIDHQNSILSFSKQDCALSSRTFWGKVFRKIFVWVFLRNVKTVNLESELNFNNLKLDISGSSRIKGYFQTSFYFNSLSVQQQRVIRNFFKPSSWAVEHVNLVQSENSILIHIRGGDYLQHSDGLGMLDSSYYFESLTSLAVNAQTRVLVVTDDPNYAKSFLEKMRIQYTLLVGPSNSSLSDSLFMMANAKKLIIANSSFSFWGALLNQEDAQICFPYPWFKKESFSRTAFPREWIGIQSSWT